jgi:hypothetical protein
MRRAVLRALTLSEPFAAARCEILSNPSQPLRALQALHINRLLHKNYKVCTKITSGPMVPIFATVVTLCGIVGLTDGGLRSVGAAHVSQPRAFALSCPSPAIYGPGVLGYLTRPVLCYEDSSSCCRMAD